MKPGAVDEEERLFPVRSIRRFFPDNVPERWYKAYLRHVPCISQEAIRLHENVRRSQNVHSGKQSELSHPSDTSVIQFPASVFR